MQVTWKFINDLKKRLGIDHLKVALFEGSATFYLDLEGEMGTNPGSPEAMRLGCTCSPLDNHYGKGAVEDGKIVDKFSVDPNCPIHQDMRRLKNAILPEEASGD